MFIARLLARQPKSHHFYIRPFSCDYFSTLHDGRDDNVAIRPSTPWVRSVISGVDLMRNAKASRNERVFGLLFQIIIEK